MTITVNGNKVDVDDPTTVADLIDMIGLDASVTVVQHNDDIVERAAYGDTPLRDGDTLELVRLVGGG